MTTKIILVLILLCSMIIPVGGFLLSKRKEGGFKAALACNLFFFFGTLLVADILLFSGNVQAAGTAAEAVEAYLAGWEDSQKALPALGLGLPWPARPARHWEP